MKREVDNLHGEEKMGVIISPKKSLGQNFLTSPAAVAKVVSAAEIKPSESVLEIGPGKGILTEKLLEAGARVIAVEKDKRLVPYLEAKFEPFIKSGNLRINEADVLQIEPGLLIGAASYKLVANIPYYITGALIRKFLGSDRKPNRAVLLLQKEVAQRIVARGGKESLLSLSIKAYGTPRIAGTVEAGSFFPKPKVDSAILVIQDISADFFNNFTEECYFRVLHAGFAQKRKQIKGNLEREFGKETTEKALAQANISPQVRAEDLSLEDWRWLCRSIFIT